MKAQRIQLDTGWQNWLEQGQGPVIVLLHGISSCAASWTGLAEAMPGHRLLAWDAPGYGDSTPVAVQQPDAGDYADRLEAWLSALDVRDCILVGHSLGALIASAYVARYGSRLKAVVLADPARGYKHESAEIREQVFHSRWPLLVKLGAEAFAEERAPRLLKPDADGAALTQVKAGMKQLHLDGFRQANWLLANDDLLDWWQQAKTLPGCVLCGDQDSITPPAAVADLAKKLGLPYIDIPDAGHASYLDAPVSFARCITELLRTLPAD